MSDTSTNPFDDSLYLRRYDKKRYNCFHFACDCLASLGMPVSYEAVLRGVMERKARGARRGFVRTDKPRDGTLYLCRNFPDDAHCGVFYRGRVLHLRESGLAWHPPHVLRLLYRKVQLYDYAGGQEGGAEGP